MRIELKLTEEKEVVKSSRAEQSRAEQSRAEQSRFSASIKTAGTDEWYTPSYAVDIIIPFLKARKFDKVLCPFDTEDSEFVKVLRNEGFVVEFSHIWEGKDFFDIDNIDVDCIVSNPPFSKRQSVFEKLYELGKPFAMIMNMNGLFDSKSRWQLFSEHKFELLIPKGRIKFSDGNRLKNSPNFQSIYVCSGVLEKQIVFTDMETK